MNRKTALMASRAAMAVLFSAALLAGGAGRARASLPAPPSTLVINHSGTACASVDSKHDLSTNPKMSQTGIAFDGSSLYVSCWGDNTITKIDPHTGGQVAPPLHVVGVNFNAQAYGALAWDRADGTLWACASTSKAGSGSPENQMSEVGIIDLALGTYTAIFQSPGCDNGLAWDPGSQPGRVDTLWTSADTDTLLYNWTPNLAGGAHRNEVDDVKPLMGSPAATSGMAIGGGKFYIANPQGTNGVLKRVYSVNAALNAYADPTEPLIASTHRYEDLECDDQSFSTTVIWVMWFNQNVLQPIPIQGTCDSPPPPPPELGVVQTSNSPSAGSSLVFTDTVHNAGPGTETNVTLSQDMPATVSFASATPSTGTCTPGATLTCSLGDLGPGDSVTVDVEFTTYGPGSVSSPVSVSSDETTQVSDDQPATVQPVPGVTYVTVSDSGITPASPAPPIGGQVRFVIQGTQPHEIADNSSLGLFDSGPIAPPAAYDYTYPSSGAYKLIEDPSGTIHAATVQVATGNPSNVQLSAGAFNVPWAATPLPGGCVEDVQVLVPGGSWANLVRGSTALGAAYTPTRTGTYKFRGRLRCGTQDSAYGTGNSTRVS